MDPQEELRRRLYGTSGTRLSSMSPVPPATTSLGATLTAPHLQSSLQPRPKAGTTTSSSSSGVGFSNTASSSALVKMRATAGPDESDHPLAATVQAQAKSKAAAAAAPKRLLQPLTLAKDRVSKLSFSRTAALNRSLGSADPTLSGLGYGESKEDPDDDTTDFAESKLPPSPTSHTTPRTFIESLNLGEAEIEELSNGNFLYLKPKAGQESNAYDLHVVAHAETNPADYYTLSRQGLTHFLGKDSEFTPLEQWERDFRLFRQIYTIPFFSKYRAWKSFTVWKRNVRGTKCGLASQRLVDGLFLLNPTLRMSLFRLRRLCVEVSSWTLFEYDESKTYSLDEFIELQAQKRSHVTLWLTEFSDDVRALVRGACDEVLDKFLADNGIQADQKMTFMERAALRTECRKLTKYIRLTEFLVRDTLLGLALGSASKLRDWVQPGYAERLVKEGTAAVVRPLFRVEVAFNADPNLLAAQEAKNQREAEQKAREEVEAAAKAALEEDPELTADASTEFKEIEVPDMIDYDAIQLVVHPELDVVRTKIQDVLLDAVSVVSGPPTLLDHPDLSPYTQAATDDTDDGGREDSDLTEIVKSHGAFQGMCDDTFSGIAAAFQDVSEHCEIFTPYKKTFLSNAVALDLVEDHYEGVPLDIFVRDIKKYRKQTSNFEEIPVSKDVGMLLVDSEALRIKLLPSPERCLAAIQALLPVLMNRRSEALLNDVTKRSAIIGSKPTEVEPFVNKVAMLEESLDKIAGLREEQDQIKAMARLMEKYEWPVPDTQKAHFTMLKEGLSQLEGHMQAAEAALDTDTRKFAADVEARVPVLKRNVLGVREKMDDPMIGSADSEVDAVCSFIERQVATMKSLKEEAERLQHYQQMLKQPVQEFDTIEDVQFDLQLKEKLWTAMQSWDAMCADWMQAPFQDINADEIGIQVATFLKTAVRAERGLPGNQAAPKLKELVDEFKTLLPAVVDLRTPALKARHWEQIEEVISHKMDPEHTYTLGELLGLNVVEHQEAIAGIATGAVQEHALEELFEGKVQAVWADLEFILSPYKETKDVFILGSIEDITVGLDDSLVTLNTILGSRYCAPMRDEVEGWQKRLILLSDTLDEWLQCQKQWMYLETIFAADDIKRQLPEESKKFGAVDKSWKTIMKRTNGNPNCMVAGTVKGLKETLQRHNEVLDQIQKSLEDYLETKRVAFPRFYFLSNEELLEILAQTRDPQAVQPHLRKCFDALVKLEFAKEAGSVDILSMISPENEVVALTKNLKARGNVEDWLMAVQKSMIESLTKLMKQGMLDYDSMDRSEFVLGHKGQIVAAIAQIAWARETEACLLDPDDPVGKMGEWFELNVKQLSALTALVRGKLTRNERKVVVALVTTDVHARDIIEIIRDNKVDQIGNFTWQQQLRYYFDRTTDTVVVKQSNASIGYGYEYQGCTSRLVITPLTDRCWMTITGAVHLKLGANPAGPAGTGKTESSKDLAKAIAIQCIVFNCSDQIDYKMMGKFFAGLAQAGAWTCLDEFNRIDIEVLSVIAQQLMQLRQGMLQELAQIEFEGRLIRLNVHAVIVTMNPGYAGRTELPDNLKVLFRPVAMMVPDYALIAEIILFAEGFDDAKNLSRKMTRLYRLSSEQLSQQRHYDFGMRAVKSVLVMAGALKRSNPTLSEDVVLIRAMRDSNVPKFLRDDLPLFHAIVGDLFPRVVVPSVPAGDLEAAIRFQLREMGMQEVDLHIEKVLQLFDTFNVRFGVVVTGPTTAGKTVAYQVLAKAMTQLREEGHESEDFQRVEINALNPKCVSMGELYGEFNLLTQEWADGLASTMIRAGAMSESMDRRWTVFDGPIDALWIENMNTVLDDNMTLCLANGERIKLKPEMRMLFEVEDLEVASPATVSRLGVVYMTPINLGWKPYQLSWIAREMPKDMPVELVEHLQSLFDDIVDDAIAFQTKNLLEPIPTVTVQKVTSLCCFYKTLFDSVPKWDWEADMRDNIKRVETIFAFALLWSIGGSISAEDDGYEKFDSFIRNHKGFGNCRFGPGVIYDLFPDFKDDNFAWTKWADNLGTFNFDPTEAYFRMVVPTMDTVRFTYILKTQLSQLNSVFFTGVTGTGKTVVNSDYLNIASDLEYTGGTQVVPIVINFSAQTSALDTQMSIESSLEKKRKTLLGAPAGKTAVVFVDDINMPAVEEYGAQPPIELLRQFQDYHGFYDREKLFWKDIESTALVAASAPPGGGRNPITRRFSRHFHMLCMPPSTDAVLKQIFGSILKGFFGAWPFADEVKSMADKITLATVDVYNRIREAMRPTPAKSHYTFNLRDVSKVFQGILMIRPKECVNADTVARLWAHENLRVFHDRLISQDDKTWFLDLTMDLLTKVLGRHGSGWSREELFENKPLIFCDFLRPVMDEEVGSIYEEAKDLSKVQTLLMDALEDYNLTNPTQMNLVFFPDAVDHVCRIARILRQPRGNAMLVGVGGSGKQSLTRMACALADHKCSQIELTRGYGPNEFREDLKKIMLISGVEGKQVVFLFTDTQIVVESFVEDLNNVLNTGEIPNLWQSDELNKIVEELRPVATQLKIPETRDNIYRLFISRLRDNLHIVLCMSPVGDALRVRCRQFPALINCCTIDWYMPWPDDALLSVATRFLAEEDLGTEEVKESVARTCVLIHQSIQQHADAFYNELRRKVYTTPKSYLDLINLYLSVLAEKREQLSKLRGRLATGVFKLEDANQQVAELQVELTKMQPVLDKKTVETEALLEQVAVDQAEADIIKDKVEAETAIVEKQAEEVAVVQADAQADLDVAMPALHKALKALDSLSKSDITEVKSFAKPPPAVRVVMEAVCILLGQKPDWDTAKRVLAGVTFMQDLKDFDKDNISPAIIRKLAKYIADPTMEVANVSKVSIACTSLCMWVHAMDVYNKVAKEVEPKKARLKAMNQQLEEANVMLKGKQDELQAVLDKVAELRRQCDETLAEKERLAFETELTKKRLVRADKLTSGLADEQVRWKLSVEAFDKQIGDLVGDVLISCGCISYYGPFTGSYREEIVAEWNAACVENKIPCSDEFSLMATMGDPVQVREWQINGLPTDKTSTDNAVLVTRGKRWPLMIDPQEQAKKWIKNTEARNKLAVTRLTHPNMLRTLENCIRIGQPLLLEDIGEYLDPALEPVLQKAVFKQSGRLLIHLGDSDVDYDPDFRLYMSTKLPNPHYLPEVCIKVTVINFTVTMFGLEDQLLGAVVNRERPDIEKKKNRLVVSMASDKKQLQDLEDKILKLLSESEGNILDDEELIRALGESKELSAVIQERLKESEKTQEEITEMRNRYRPIAIRGALIYFVVADLALIDPMYQYSLTYFVRLYNMCIDDSVKSDDLDERLQNLTDYLTATVYTNVCRGLFEAHKLLFSFLISISILRNSNDVSTSEWLLLLRGAGLVSNPKKNPMPELIPVLSWNFLWALEESLPQYFEGIVKHVQDNDLEWRRWAELSEPHQSPLPDPWHDNLNLMQRMLLLKAFREEKVLFSIKDFVKTNLGEHFIQTPPTSMADIHGDSDAATPIIFILSVGADPTGMLYSYAKQVGFLERLRLISLGQGQGERAQKMVEAAVQTGDWVLLQNCHLAKSWMPSLEKLVDSFSADGADGGVASHINPDFRLFLTSMPADYFPVPVLQNGVKLTNEPPKGIRANLQRSLANIESWTDFEVCEGDFADRSKLSAWKKLSFGLCFFHAVMQERRKFGSLGWNIIYEFNDSDLETSVQILKMFLEEQPRIPWDALLYVTGHINYGGRVTDDWDRRCLMDILSQYFTEDILEEGHVFSPSGIYYAPKESPLSVYRDYVKQLPMDDGPEIFGMHENANISFQAQETRAILTTCLMIQPRTSSSAEGARSPDEIAAELAAEIEAALPPVLEMEEAGKNTFVYKGEHMDSLATVLGQEMVRFNKLLKVMSRSLSDVQRAIKGEILMSDELDLMYTALLNNTVPGNWEAAAYPSLKPLASWVKDLHARITFIRTWLVNGQPPVFWMSGFFFPQGFTTGTLQNHARKYSVAIDTLTFSFAVLDAVDPADVPAEEVPEDGVLVNGLFMDGARWDRETRLLTDLRPREMFSSMPVIHFMPEQHYKSPPGVYTAPCYKTSTRAGMLSTTGISTNFVVGIDLPTDINPSAWTLKGAALLCQLNT